MGEFEKIVKDKYIIDLYNDIAKYEEENKVWANHGYIHVMNVTNMVESILNQLGYSKDVIEDAKIASILHDLGCIQGKENHEIRSYDMAKEYLERNNIILNNKEDVLNAIKGHRDEFNTDSIIGISLIFADKIDIKKGKLTKAGYDIEGLKEIQYINDIKVFIENNNLIVKFYADAGINKSALESYYFTAKIFKGIYGFANKVKLNPIVLFNDIEWKI